MTANNGPEARRPRAHVQDRRVLCRRSHAGRQAGAAAAPDGRARRVRGEHQTCHRLRLGRLAPTLDERGTEGFSHRDTAAWLASSRGVPGWWAQTITVGYERARGLRRPHQTTVAASRSTCRRPSRSRSSRSGGPSRTRPSAPRGSGPTSFAVRTSSPPRHARFDFRDDGSARPDVARGEGRFEVDAARGAFATRRPGRRGTDARILARAAGRARAAALRDQ